MYTPWRFTYTLASDIMELHRGLSIIYWCAICTMKIAEGDIQKGGLPTSEDIVNGLDALKTTTAILRGMTDMENLTAAIPDIPTYLGDKFLQINGLISSLKSSMGTTNATEFNTTTADYATQLISIIEDLGAVALRLISTPEYTLTVGNIDMHIFRKNVTNFKGFEYTSKGEGQPASMSVPAEAKQETMAGIVAFTVQGLESMLSAGTDGTVVTPITSCSVVDAFGKPLPVYSTKDPVIVIFGYLGNRPNKAEKEVAACSFMKMDRNGRFSGWSEEQCDIVSQSDDQVVCRCTHLTVFSVIYRKERSAEQLQLFVWLGCASTALCCLITAMTMVGYRLLDSTRSYVRLNFLMSLGMSEAMFLAGVRYTNVPAVCMMVAGFLHFSVLASFCWLFSYILLLGTEMRMTNLYRRSMTAGMYTVIGWLLPLCIVTITIIARHGVYRDPHYCWITSGEFLHVSLLAPAGLILIISWVILGYVINMYQKQRHDPTIVFLLALTWSGIVSCTVISPLLTATWFLGTFSVAFRAIWLQAMFTTCNIILGFTIFFLMCYLNTEVRTAARRERKVTPVTIHPNLYTPTTIKNEHKFAECGGGEECIHKSKCFYGQTVNGPIDPCPQATGLTYARQDKWQALEHIRQGTARLPDVFATKMAASASGSSSSSQPNEAPGGSSSQHREMLRSDSKTELLPGNSHDAEDESVL